MLPMGPKGEMAGMVKRGEATKKKSFGATNSTPDVATPDRTPFLERVGSTGRIPAAGITIPP